MRLALSALALTAVVLSGCSSKPILEKPANADLATAADITELVQANNRFSLDLLRNLTPGRNVFASPFAVSLAVSLTFANNDGDALPRSLRVPFTQDRLNTTYAGLLWKVQNSGQPRPNELRLANAVWLTTREDFKPFPEYIEKAKANYTAPPHSVDFLAGGVDRINRWCGEKSLGKITQILDPEDVNAETVAVVTSAIYFKGDWKTRFKKTDTRSRKFHVSARETVNAEFMHQTLRTGYASTEDAQVLELPYRGEDLSMFVLLPRIKDGLADLEKNLTAEQIDGWMRTLAVKEVVVDLPRFTLAGAALPLKETLEAMGWPMKLAPAIGEPPPGLHLEIDRVIHRGFVEVTEEGSEAAAVKAVRSYTKDGPMPSKEAVTFKADHPFLFLIRDKKTGCVLFIGRLVEPR